MRNHLLGGMLGVALVLGSCGGKPGEGTAPTQESAVDGVPDFSALSFEVSGAADEGVSAAALPEGEEQVRASAGEGAPEYLAKAKEGIRELNEAMRRLMTPVNELLAGQSVVQGETRVFGPKDGQDELTYRLIVRAITEQRFGFKLEAKPKGGEDGAYKVVLAGHMNKDAAARRGRGQVGVDLDTYKTLKPTFPGGGKLLAGFASTERAKTVTYRLSKFTPNSALRSPLDAAVVGHKLDSGATAVRIASFSNVVPTEALELVLSRTRHVPGTGGRLDMTASKGDIPEGVVFWATACWSASEQKTFQVLRRCETGTGGRCTVVPESVYGQATDCPTLPQAPEAGDGGTAPSTPAADDTAPEPGAPTTDVAPPGSMPTGTE